jgi:YYY domain-containing protein
VIAVASWALLGEGLAWCWFVIAWPFFGGWPDRGFGLSKIAGILLLGSIVWVGAWAGLPVLNPSASWIIAALIACTAVAALRPRVAALQAFLRGSGARWLACEATWLIAFGLFLVLRAMNPAIAGGEKFMDFSFFNSAIRATGLPPPDPWLSGHGLNYYFFGYVTWAAVARMLPAPAAVSYNLAMASVPAAVAAGVFSVTLALTRRSGLAVGSAAGVVCLGNLAGAAQVGALGGPFDIWRPTRVIPGTINEFPFFSFLWGDLHPHVLAMPNLVLFVGLAYAWYEQGRRAVPSRALAAALGVSAGVGIATSIWDLAPIGTLLTAVAVWRVWRGDVRTTATDALIVLASALAIVLPAAAALNTGGVHIGLATLHSPLGDLLLVQGAWMLPSVILLCLRAWQRNDHVGTSCAGAVALAAGLLVHSATAGLLTGLATMSWIEALRADDPFPWLPIATAFTMLMTAEYIYVDDAYGRALERMNIVFKLHLHAYLLLGLGWGFCCLELWRQRSTRTRLALVASLAALALPAAVYPVGAVGQRIREAATRGFGLDGTRYLQVDHPGDFDLIGFINRTIVGHPVVVEATSASYSYGARVSANTGLPTILGWAGHERLWRRSPASAIDIAKRADAVRVLYEGNAAQARNVIAEYQPRYIVVGDYERRLYPSGDFDKFDRLGDKIFDRDGTQLFEVRPVARRR